MIAYVAWVVVTASLSASLYIAALVLLIKNRMDNHEAILSRALQESGN